MAKKSVVVNQKHLNDGECILIVQVGEEREVKTFKGIDSLIKYAKCFANYLTPETPCITPTIDL